jgi:nitrogen regulatory protein PII
VKLITAVTRPEAFEAIKEALALISKILSTSDPDSSMLWCGPVDVLVRVPTSKYGLNAL